RPASFRRGCSTCKLWDRGAEFLFDGETKEFVHKIGTMALKAMNVRAMCYMLAHAYLLRSMFSPRPSADAEDRRGAAVLKVRQAAVRGLRAEKTEQTTQTG